MKATIELNLKGFRVPNFVTTTSELGTGENGDCATSIGLAMLEPETLDKLCSDFRAEVFKKAKKSPPPECREEDPRIVAIRRALDSDKSAIDKLDRIAAAL